MGKELWGSKAIGEKTQRQLDSIRSKKKIVKMFILVVLIFGLRTLLASVSRIFHLCILRYQHHLPPVYATCVFGLLLQYYRSAICGWRNCTDCTFERSDSYSLRNTPSNSKSGDFKGNYTKKNLKQIRRLTTKWRDGTLRHRYSSTRRERRYENGDAVQHTVVPPTSKNYCEGKLQLDHICRLNTKRSHRSRGKKTITTDL
nr:unnamed protein product [Callosobruchus analis]